MKPRTPGELRNSPTLPLHDESGVERKSPGAQGLRPNAQPGGSVYLPGDGQTHSDNLLSKPPSSEPRRRAGSFFIGGGAGEWRRMRRAVRQGCRAPRPVDSRPSLPGAAVQAPAGLLRERLRGRNGAATSAGAESGAAARRLRGRPRDAAPASGPAGRASLQRALAAPAAAAARPAPAPPAELGRRRERPAGGGRGRAGSPSPARG
jgi:hypothetical protein